MNVFIVEDSSEYRIAVAGQNSGLSDNGFGNHISAVLCISDQANKVLFQSEPMEFQEGSKNAPLLVGAVFQIDKKLVPTGLIDKTFKFSIKKDDNCYYFVTDYNGLFVESQNINESSALRFFPFYTNLSDGEVEFALSVKRAHLKENEYLPSSEDLRIEVKTQSGKTIWTSTEGKNFLQVISEVKPVEVGDVHVYSMKWDGKSRSGKPFKSGTYIVELTIPAQPDNYTVTMKYERIYNDD
ncbi:MAG: BsuPI-related putative proteinase inhibitor [Candidatus Kapabacteria bacterium]|nr:BsuPI-related putative proteinase inhibitor [Candidatus Kapabacteria bacterium]